MYYNPETQERISYQELCKKYNASIPTTKEVFNGWFKLMYADVPAYNEFQDVKEGAIVLNGDRYYITYVVENIALDAAKDRKLEQLVSLFDKVEEDSYLISSLGFRVDANSTANRNVQGLVTVLEGTDPSMQISFCDYDNNFHQLSLDQIRTIQLEIIQQGQNLYAQKWVYRNQIMLAEDVDTIANIDMKILYTDYQTNSSFVPGEDRISETRNHEVE